MNPPIAPPSAFPRVPVIISTLPRTPFNSIVPLPVFPIKPEAWHSSTITKASYLSARSQISSNCATIPSMEKTPSVTIILKRWFCLLASINWASKSPMSLFA